MGTTRYRNGDVTVTLSGDLEAWARSAVDAAAGATVKILETGMGAVASKGESEWYNLVERETGKSGDLDVVTTIDVSKGEVRVSVGSTDTRTVQAYKRRGDGSAADAGRQLGGSTKPLVAFVHESRPGTLVRKEVDRKTWYATDKRLRGAVMRGDGVYSPKPGVAWPESGLRYFIYAKNPKPGTGAFLLQKLVRKPATKAIKDLTPALGESIAARIQGGGRG